MAKLQPRDIHFLQTLSRFGILSSNQIAEYFFNGTALTTTLRRLRVLEKSRIILNPGHLQSGEKVWTLSKEGARRIGAGEPFRYSNQNTFSHDVCLSEVRFTLESLGLGDDWTSEAEMKRNINPYYSNSSVIPDGLFIADICGEPQVVSLELELSAKSHKRYRSLFIDYTYKSAISHVWYVVKDEPIITPILKQWREVMDNKRLNEGQNIIFSHFDDLISEKHNAKIFDENLNSKSLHSVFSLTRPCQGLSRQNDCDQSTGKILEFKPNQQVTAAPEIEKKVPYVLDPSPPTLERGRGLQTLKISGAEVQNNERG
jgi:hypothetical protein